MSERSLWADCDWAAGHDHPRRRLCASTTFTARTSGVTSSTGSRGTLHPCQGAPYGQRVTAARQAVAAFRRGGVGGRELTPYGTSALWSLRRAMPRGRAAPRSRGVAVDAPADLHGSLLQLPGTDQQPRSYAGTRSHIPTSGVDYLKRSWNLSAQAYYRPGATSSTGSGARTWAASGIPNRRAASIPSGSNSRAAICRFDGRLPASRDALLRIHHQRPNADIIARSAMDFMRHKAALAVEVHFLRRMSLALTGSVYDRNGSYTHYPEPGNASLTKNATTSPISCSTAVCRGEKASAGSMSLPRTSPIPVTAIWAAFRCRASGARAG